MKKIIACMLLLALAAAVFTGCTSSNTGAEQGPVITKAPFTGHIEPKTFAPEKPNEGLAMGNVLFWETFRSGGSSTERIRYKVYNDVKEFLADFPGRDEEFNSRYSEKSFGEMFVAAVYITVPTGGYSYSVNAGSVSGSEIKLDILQTSPEADTAVTQAFETHCVLAAFPAELYTEGMRVTVIINGKCVLPAGETV